MKERFSPRAVAADRMGTTTEKNQKTARATKRANQKGKYETRVVNGVKYMTLRSSY
jgi:hypothetical protein